MLKKIFENLFGIMLVLALFGTAYWMFARTNIFYRLLNTYAPCQYPIRYSLGVLDKRFGISQLEFLQIVERAEDLWEGSIGQSLFAYQEDSGDVTINLLYDLRQEITKRLQSLGITIKEDASTYQTLETEYGSLLATYQNKLIAFGQKQNSYLGAQEQFNQEVAYWNKRGGAARDEYARLQQEQQRLESEYLMLRAASSELNEIAENVNAVASVLNRLASILDLKVDRYNNIGSQQPEEFEEGTYIQNQYGTEINIYQFENKDKLFRVLAHELGHALGLEHLENPKAMMYRLNQDTSEYLTQEDVVALKAKCNKE